MKLGYAFVLLFLILMPLSYASMNVDQVKGYINNERASDVDESGGDFETQPNDIVDLVVTLDNTENTTSQAKLKLTVDNIDNGDDIVKEQDWYDIAAKDDKSKTLSFTIPGDARRDDYDMDLKIWYKLSNGTEYEIGKIDFNIIVETIIEKTTTLDLYGMLGNLTSSCESLAQSTNTCFGYIDRFDNCSNELSTVKEERGTYKQKSDDLEGAKGICETDKAGLTIEKTNLNNQIQNMMTISQCNNQTATAVNRTRKEGEDKYNQTLSFAGLIAFVFWFQQKQKKKKISVESSYHSDYYNK